jgi:hypothetical protein
MLAELDLRDRLLALLRESATDDTSRHELKQFGDAIGAGRYADLYRLAVKRETPVAKALRPAAVEALRATIRLRPVRMDRVFLDDRSLYYLKARRETDLPEVSGLAMQIGYVDDKGKTYEGWAIYDGMKPSARHMAATSLSSRDLRLADIANARVQLWLDDLLIAESLLKPEPKEFPVEESNVLVGPDLLGPDETLNAGTRARMRKYTPGRYPGRIP